MVEPNWYPPAPRPGERTAVGGILPAWWVEQQIRTRCTPETAAVLVKPWTSEDEARFQETRRVERARCEMFSDWDERFRAAHPGHFGPGNAIVDNVMGATIHGVAPRFVSLIDGELPSYYDRPRPGSGRTRID